MTTPEDKNGIKFESFVFDALQDVQRSVSIEVERGKEFSPLKNSEGENSPQTVHHDLKNTWGRWLESAGFNVPRNEKGQIIPDIEISPLFALDAQELCTKKDKIRIGEGDIDIG